MRLTVFILLSISLSILCYSYISLDLIFEQLEMITGLVQNFGVYSAIAFLTFYTVCVAFSVPNASVLTFLAGFLFGTVGGGMIAYTGALGGSILLFTMIRAGFKDNIVKRARNHPAFDDLDFGICKNPFTYMFFMRLFPFFPFWLVNLAPAILGIRLKVFVITTALGILPGTFIVATIGNKVRVFSLYSDGVVSHLTSDPLFFFVTLGLSVIIICPILWRIVKRVQ